MQPILEITVCYTMLEKAMISNPILADETSKRLVDIFRCHRMVLSEKLMVLCEEYFEKQSPAALQWYQDFCAQAVHVESLVRIVSDGDAREIPSADAYMNELVSVCRRSCDQVLLTEKTDKIIPIIRKKKWDIDAYNAASVMKCEFENKLYRFTLPVARLMVRPNMENRVVAEWLGKFLEREPYVQIYDMYLATEAGLHGLRTCILPFIKEGTDIEIYTSDFGGMTEADICAEFQKKAYRKWNLQIYLVRSKSKLHERTIQGEHFIIQLDKGLSIFGLDGKTDKAPVSIMRSEAGARTIVQESGLKSLVLGD